MSSLIVATFNNQFAVSSAVDKLLSRGMHREQLRISLDESVGNSAASSSAPTSVLSILSHQGHRQDQKASEVRSPSHLPAPDQMGHNVLTVMLDAEMDAHDIRHLMERAGATSVIAREAVAPLENPQWWPEIGTGNRIDVERAICASRGGEALGPHARH
ncbi:hypothetical protein [Dyella sp. ASV21]|uniref:hypothetical protein n=1 Tax=Dyella sp. ASV21 TaxID=2795114 RepID=UPI0018EB140D|nr:hypothetical protein [Dyella sp. ASV21]